MTLFFDRRIEIKNPDQIRGMRVAGLVVGRTLARLRAAAVPGVSTAELDRLAEKSIRDQGGIPSFLGYSEPPFPASICTSINDEVVHGIPGDRVLADGDLLSIDCGAHVDGWHGDAAISLGVGAVSAEATTLMKVTEDALWQGLAAVRVGARIGDVSAAVQSWVEQHGDYGIVHGYTGHGIGSAMHMEPEVPNYGRAGRGPRLKLGMALAVEPMITLGADETILAGDEWTVLSADRSLAAHHEHTCALTERGLWVLTAEDGGRERLEALGVPYGGD